VEIGVLDLRD